MVVINHIDDGQVDLEATYAEVQEAFGSECLAVNLPAADGTSVIDCFFKAKGDPAFSSAGAAHTEIVDQTVEVDETLMATYLDQGEVASDQLHDAFEQAMREGHLIPVCCVSATPGVGVQELLNFISRLFPTPSEGNPQPFLTGCGQV